MPYIVMRQNVKSSRRVYRTAARLVKAIIDSGAVRAEVRPERVEVVWSTREDAPTHLYGVDAEGNVDYQLAWDMAAREEGK